MKPYLVSALAALMTVALALAFFFAGFFVRGWVDEEREEPVVALPTAAAKTATPSAQTTPSSSSPTAVAPTATPGVVSVSVDDDPARGPQNAKVTIVEFSDFQCPACKTYADQTEPLILATYGDRIRYVFRDLPAQSHPQAQKAAEAAQCAFEQGKFWEYHDKLFQNQAALDVDSLKAYAKELGLNESTFNTCLDSGKYTQEVQKDYQDAISYGVTSIPTFFINGRKVVGAGSFGSFQSIIEEELAKAGTR